MKYILWIVQLLLAALFMFSGVAKLITPVAEMTKQIQMPGWFLHFIGVMEILGSLGLILPSLLRIRPGLTPLAASGLAIITIGATVITIPLGAIVLLPAITALLSIFVAYGRWRLAPSVHAAVLYRWRMSTQERGRLKVFLGYASGTGKSYRMLAEGIRRRQRGQDVVVGAVQPRTSQPVDDLLKTMEVVPMKQMDGTAAMDMDALLRRHPEICIVDGLASDNPAGNRNAHRWQDVEDLLAAGITIIASINLQYIEQQRDAVKAITGKRAVQTIPQSFLETADEIELVDAPHSDEPSAGLPALRRLALVLTADVVDASLRRYLEVHGLKQNWRTNERILVCVAPGVSGGDMIQAGQRVAERFNGDLIVACVRDAALSAADAAGLERDFKLARAARARIEMLNGKDPIQVIARYARANGITQIFAGHSRTKSWRTRLFGTRTNLLVRAVPEIDVRVFPV